LLLLFLDKLQPWLQKAMTLLEVWIPLDAQSVLSTTISGVIPLPEYTPLKEQSQPLVSIHALQRQLLVVQAFLITEI